MAVEVDQLRSRIEAAYAGGEMDEEAVEETIAALDRGDSGPSLGRGLDRQRGRAGGDLDFFARGRWSREVGPFEYHDKIPLKTGYEEPGYGSCPRRSPATGSLPRAGVILMPSYVNIGAWVGPDTMVDTWATVARARRSARACTSPAGSASAACSSRRARAR